VLFCVWFVCVYCTALLPPGVNPIAVNKCIIPHHELIEIREIRHCFRMVYSVSQWCVYIPGRSLHSKSHAVISLLSVAAMCVCQLPYGEGNGETCSSYFYCCTVHTIELFNSYTNWRKYIKFHFKILKSLRHVSIRGSSSGSYSFLAKVTFKSHWFILLHYQGGVEACRIVCLLGVLGYVCLCCAVLCFVDFLVGFNSPVAFICSRRTKYFPRDPSSENSHIFFK